MQQDEGDCTSSLNKQGEHQLLRAVGQEDQNLISKGSQSQIC